jgi:hypothetical protein
LLDKLEIKAGVDTPYIIFDPETLSCEVSGKSYPPDVLKFYEPVMDWLDDFRLLSKEKLVVTFKLDYYNTASSKILLEIFYKLEEIRKESTDVSVNWYYPDDDEEMLEVGEEFQRLVNVPFKHISYVKKY